MKGRIAIACLILAAGGLFPQPATAQESTGDRIDLSLNQSLKMALENNLELISARYNPKIAETDIDAQQSAFDVGLQTDYAHTESARAQTAFFSVPTEEQDTVSLSVDQQLKFGATYQATFFSQKRSQAGPQVLAPNQIFSGFQLNFTQPLLKGFGSSVATEQLVLAENNAKISQYDLMARANQIVEQVEGAYWNVVAAREALRIERFALTRAQELLDLNRRKVEVGSLAPIEITQAEAGVASQEENVIVAETALFDAEDELRRLMGVPAGDPMWNQSIYNLDAPQFRSQPVDLQQTIETALRERPELHSLRQTVSNRELSHRVARRQLRNQLDLSLDYSPTGASLDEVDPMTMMLINMADFGDSISGIGDVYDWTAGVTYRMTFGNRAAKATFARNGLSLDQSKADLADQEQTIRVEVRQAVRGVESGIKRVEAATANVRLQRRKLEAEQKKYENGMSTSFEVLTFQNDLAAAELAEVRARSDYLKAQAALERVKGTLLAARGLSLGE